LSAAARAGLAQALAPIGRHMKRREAGRTSGLPRVVQGVISRRPSVRAISVDRMSYKNASAKQTHD
jgi:hypothetical protein